MKPTTSILLWTLGLVLVLSGTACHTVTPATITDAQQLTGKKQDSWC